MLNYLKLNLIAQVIDYYRGEVFFKCKSEIVFSKLKKDYH